MNLYNCKADKDLGAYSLCGKSTNSLPLISERDPRRIMHGP